MMYVGTEPLEFWDGYTMQHYQPFTGRVQHHVGDGADVVRKHPDLFRPINGGRASVRSALSAMLDLDPARLRSSDPQAYDGIRAAIIEAKRALPHHEPLDPSISAAHLVDDIRHQQSHVRRHAEEIAANPGDQAAVAANVEHVLHHHGIAEDGAAHLQDHQSENDVKHAVFAAETKKVQASTSPWDPSSPEQSNSADEFGRAHLERMRSARMRRRAPYAKKVELVPFRGGHATISQRAHDLILRSARASRGVETGGILFADTIASHQPHIREASTAGPDAECTPTSYMVDVDHDMAMIEDHQLRGMVEAGSFHTHVGGAAPHKDLDRPSDADLRRWAMLRQTGGTHLGVIVRMPIDTWDSPPRFFAWLVRDSATGLGTIAEPVTLTLR
jgi:hypothetical protein